MNNNIKKIILALLLSCNMTGCVVIAGAAIGVVTAGAIIYDHRTPDVSEQDKWITKQIKYQLSKNEAIAHQTYIVVSTFDRVVLLAGQSPTKELKQQAMEIAQNIPGIKKIYNQIAVEIPTHSTSTAAEDNWIATKIRTKLISRRDLNSGSIQIVVVNSNVYLMGTVSQYQAHEVTKVAQHVSGVKRIVKLFQYREDL
ncbi:MAG: BON domain-containing protein [Gammaproteobacteria bacterium]